MQAYRYGACVMALLGSRDTLQRASALEGPILPDEVMVSYIVPSIPLNMPLADDRDIIVIRVVTRRTVNEDTPHFPLGLGKGNRR